MQRAACSRSLLSHSDSTLLHSRNDIKTVLSRGNPWRIQTANVHHHRERQNILRFLGVIRSNRQRPDKHWNPLFRAERGRLFIRVLGLDEVGKNQKPGDEMTAEFARSARKNMNLDPKYDLGYSEATFAPETLGEIVDTYKPEENRKSFSFTDKAIKKIQSYTKGESQIRKDPNHKQFRAKDFAETEALELFENANMALVERDIVKLMEYATEPAARVLWGELKRKSVVWKLHGEISVPTVVQAVVAQGYNYKYAQITVKFHTKQSLAVYDRFGRLIQGSESVIQDLIEYVVFEKALDAPNGKWRVHGKIRSESNELPPPLAITTPRKRREPEKEETAVVEKGSAQATA